MFAVPLSSSGSQQQQQQGVEPSSSTSEWGNSPSIANMASSGSSSSNLSTTGGGWGSSGPFQQQNGQQAAAGSNGGSAGPSVSSSSTPVTDALNKQPSSSNSNSSSEWMVSPSASSMVWQTTAEPSGDNNNNNRNANPWNTPNPSSSSGFPTMSGKNNSLPNGNGNGNGSSNGNGGGAAQQYQAANGASAQPQDKENVNPSTPVSAERTPLDNMIYREGWGQVEVKQEVPWMVPESPPPIHDDPSVWKPKANTGTEVWEKSTGHRTQPWQNQAPNTPRWISGDEEPSSLWSSAGGAAGGPLAAAPSNSANMMQSASALSGANGGGILSNGAMNASVLGSQGGRPAWTSSGSGDSSGGNISPSNQWNSDVQDQEWSEWRDPSSRGSKSEKADDGTSHWGGMDRGADRQAQMRDQQRNGMYNPPGSNSGGGGMKKAEERQRGWQESAYGNSASMQSQAASEWSSVNGDNEWTSGANDKRSQQPQWPSTSSSTLRDQHAQQRFSPPNNMAKHAREQIYQTKQYQGLLEMGFKREEIDVAMRNNMMNYEATLNELKRRRAQQQAQQMPMQQSSANSSSNAYGDGYKSGLAGLVSAGSASSQAVGQAQQSHLMQQSHQDMNKGQANRAPAVPNIEALAHQLSVAARQGIISSRLLTQPLAPQTTYLLHKLMQSHRQMQNLTAQHEMLSKQHSPNPALQQRNMQQIVMAVNKIKSDISTLQKQIESVQNEFMRSSSDPRFQSGPSLVDLTSSMPASGAFSDFQNAASPQAAAAAWQRNMPTEHAAHYGAAAGDASSWMNAGVGSQFMGGGMAAAAAFGMPAVAAGMWNAPTNQWAAMGHSAAPAMGPYRQMALSATSNVEDWTAHTMMKSPSAPTPSDHNVLSPTSRTMSQNNMSAYGSDDTDGSHHWGGNRQGDTSSYGGGSGSNTFGRFAWDTLPEFVPGKPWQGSQLLSADEDPHLTPGSVAKSPLSLNTTSTGTSGAASSSGNGGGNGNGGSGQRYGNDGSQ